MPEDEKQTRKRKFLEGTGCLLYILAFAVMAAVFVARCQKAF